MDDDVAWELMEPELMDEDRDHFELSEIMDSGDEADEVRDATDGRRVVAALWATCMSKMERAMPELCA